MQYLMQSTNFIITFILMITGNEKNITLENIEKIDKALELSVKKLFN